MRRSPATSDFAGEESVAELWIIAVGVDEGAGEVRARRWPQAQHAGRGARGAWECPALGSFFESRFELRWPPRVSGLDLTKPKKGKGRKKNYKRR
jgi:hypothetical protein